MVGPPVGDGMIVGILALLVNELSTHEIDNRGNFRRLQHACKSMHRGALFAIGDYIDHVLPG